MLSGYKMCRLKTDMTAQEAATKLGVSITTLLSWENYKTSPDGYYVKAMSELYGVTADELVANERDLDINA